MALTPAQIAQAESEKFLDSQFAPLDTSSSISLQQLPDEQFEASDHHGLNNVDIVGRGAGSLALKKSITELAGEPQVLAELAKNNPVAAEALHGSMEVAADNESREFMKRHQEYLRADGNLDGLTSVLAFNELGWSEQEVETRDIEEAREALIQRGSWTAQNLELAWDALRSRGLAELRPGQIKKLSAEEELEVTRLGQSAFQLGDVNAAVRAVVRYCGYALNRDEDEIAEDFMEPSVRPVMDKAVLFVFERCNPLYIPSREHRAAILDYAAGRPLTLPLLAAAWQHVQNTEQHGFSRELLRTDEPAQDNLDDLDDDEVQALYKKTRSYIARTHPGPGILN